MVGFSLKFLFFGKLMIDYSFDFFLVSTLFSFSVSSWFNLGRLYVSRIHQFLLDCLICWHIILHSHLSISFVSLWYELYRLWIEEVGKFPLDSPLPVSPLSPRSLGGSLYRIYLNMLKKSWKRGLRRSNNLDFGELTKFLKISFPWY